MNRSPFRPQVEQLDGRCLPSGNPTLSITDADITEGNTGQAALVFTVSLSKPSSKQVSVKFATADWAATAGSDYVSRSGTLTFAPGETTKTIDVQVNGDEVVVGHERFFVNLSEAKNARLADAQGVGSIWNDDLYPGTYIDPQTGWPIPIQVPPPPDDGSCNWDNPNVCP
jgi:hypothetical protein